MINGCEHDGGIYGCIVCRYNRNRCDDMNHILYIQPSVIPQTVHRNNLRTAALFKFMRSPIRSISDALYTSTVATRIIIYWFMFATAAPRTRIPQHTWKRARGRAASLWGIARQVENYDMEEFINFWTNWKLRYLPRSEVFSFVYSSHIYETSMQARDFRHNKFRSRVVIALAYPRMQRDAVQAITMGREYYLWRAGFASTSCAATSLVGICACERTSRPRRHEIPDWHVSWLGNQLFAANKWTSSIKCFISCGHFCVLMSVIPLVLGKMIGILNLAILNVWPNR